MTAFVVRSFHRAGQFIPTIDKNLLIKPIRFLVDQQQSDGSFEEPGVVLHTDMQVKLYFVFSLSEATLIELIHLFKRPMRNNAWKFIEQKERKKHK